MKERFQLGIDKIRDFISRLKREETKDKLLKTSKDIYIQAKNGLLAYIKTGKAKIEKVQVENKIASKYQTLGMILELKVREGEIIPDEKIKEIIMDIEELKEQLREIDEKIKPLKI